ncbi:helix-turn-helix transcriptional regulator [Actinomadura geliboluensis]|uniref:helix-turn-helix transcriptional regulator n=1 Tax=Actinomadura geliboluensis TaxID=882440 RepID=UPI00262127CE|nr:helix-turn-helix transcriptional regulator [Actinomadura geliboluensis]
MVPAKRMTTARKTVAQCPMDGPRPSIDRAIARACLATAREELLVMFPGTGEEWERFGRPVRPAARRGMRVVVREAGRRRARGVRVRADLSAFLVVADRVVGVHADERGRAGVVRAADRIAELVEAFECHWGHARLPDEQADSAVHLQEEILGRLAAGATDAVVAKELGISRRTVQRHVNRTMDALGVRSRFELGMRLAAGDWAGACGC